MNKIIKNKERKEEKQMKIKAIDIVSFAGDLALIFGTVFAVKKIIDRIEAIEFRTSAIESLVRSVNKRTVRLKSKCASVERKVNEFKNNMNFKEEV